MKNMISSPCWIKHFILAATAVIFSLVLANAYALETPSVASTDVKQESTQTDLNVMEKSVAVQEKPEAPQREISLQESNLLQSIGKKVETKTISGEIGARSLSGIALVYAKNTKKRSSREMWLPYADELELVGYESKADVSEGDYARVTYDEMVDEGKRVLTGIELVKKFVPPVEEVEEDEEK